MKKKQMPDYEEEYLKKKFNQCIHICFGRVIKKFRLVSPMSHEEMEMLSSINSSTAAKVENNSNFEIKTFIPIFYFQQKSINCEFRFLPICKTLIQCLDSGDCLVIERVKSSELHKYHPDQILFWQDSDDIEELKNRAIRQDAKIQKGFKVHKASIAKRNASNKPKTKKKKTKK